MRLLDTRLRAVSPPRVSGGMQSRLKRSAFASAYIPVLLASIADKIVRVGRQGIAVDAAGEFLELGWIGRRIGRIFRGSRIRGPRTGKIGCAVVLELHAHEV